MGSPLWPPGGLLGSNIQEGIDNSKGSFLKVVDSMRRGKYMPYTRICVYMNITKPLRESIELEYHEEVSQQPINYEHIPFRCCRCHEYGHLFWDCLIK